MSEDKRIKTLEGLKSDYEDLDLYEKILLDFCRPYYKIRNLDLTSLDKDLQVSEPESGIGWTPMSFIKLELLKDEYESFLELNNKDLSSVIDCLALKGYIKIKEDQFRLSSFRLQTFIYEKSEELYIQLDNEKNKPKVSGNKLSNTLIRFRDGSSEFLTNPLSD